MAGLEDSNNARSKGLNKERFINDEKEASMDLYSDLLEDELIGTSQGTNMKEKPTAASVELERLRKEIQKLKQQNKKLKTDSEETSKRLNKKDAELAVLKQRTLSCGKCCSSSKESDTKPHLGHTSSSSRGNPLRCASVKQIDAPTCQNKIRRISPELLMKYSESTLSSISNKAVTQVGKGDTFHEYLKLFPDSSQKAGENDYAVGLEKQTDSTSLQHKGDAKEGQQQVETRPSSASFSAVTHVLSQDKADICDRLRDSHKLKQCTERSKSVDDEISKSATENISNVDSCNTTTKRNVDDKNIDNVAVLKSIPIEKSAREDKSSSVTRDRGKNRQAVYLDGSEEKERKCHGRERELDKRKQRSPSKQALQIHDPPRGKSAKQEQPNAYDPVTGIWTETPNHSEMGTTKKTPNTSSKTKDSKSHKESSPHRKPDQIKHSQSKNTPGHKDKINRSNDKNQEKNRKDHIGESERSCRKQSDDTHRSEKRHDHVKHERKKESMERKEKHHRSSTVQPKSQTIHTHSLSKSNDKKQSHGDSRTSSKPPENSNNSLQKTQHRGETGKTEKSRPELVDDTNKAFMKFKESRSGKSRSKNKDSVGDSETQKENTCSSRDKLRVPGADKTELIISGSKSEAIQDSKSVGSNSKFEISKEVGNLGKESKSCKAGSKSEKDTPMTDSTICVGVFAKSESKVAGVSSSLKEKKHTSKNRHSHRKHSLKTETQNTTSDVKIDPICVQKDKLDNSKEEEQVVLNCMKVRQNSASLDHSSEQQSFNQHTLRPSATKDASSGVTGKSEKARLQLKNMNNSGRLCATVITPVRSQSNVSSKRALNVLSSQQIGRPFKIPKKSQNTSVSLESPVDKRGFTNATSKGEAKPPSHVAEKDIGISSAKPMNYGNITRGQKSSKSISPHTCHEELYSKQSMNLNINLQTLQSGKTSVQANAVESKPKSMTHVPIKNLSETVCRTVQNTSSSKVNTIPKLPDLNQVQVVSTDRPSAQGVFNPLINQRETTGVVPDILLNLITDKKIPEKRESLVPSVNIKPAMQNNYSGKADGSDRPGQRDRDQDLNTLNPKQKAAEISAIKVETPHTEKPKRLTYPVPKPKKIITSSTDDEHLLAYLCISKRRNKEMFIDHKRNRRVEQKRLGAKRPVTEYLAGETMFGGCQQKTEQKTAGDQTAHEGLTSEKLNELWELGVDVTDPDVLSAYLKMEAEQKNASVSTFENSENDKVLSSADKALGDESTSNVEMSGLGHENTATNIYSAAIYESSVPQRPQTECEKADSHMKMVHYYKAEIQSKDIENSILKSNVDNVDVDTKKIEPGCDEEIDIKDLENSKESHSPKQGKDSLSYCGTSPSESICKLRLSISEDSRDGSESSQMEAQIYSRIDKTPELELCQKISAKEQTCRNLEIELFGEDSSQLPVNSNGEYNQRDSCSTVSANEMNQNEDLRKEPEPKADLSPNSEESEIDVGDTEYSIDPSAVHIEIDFSEDNSCDSSQSLVADTEASIDVVDQSDPIDTALKSSADISNIPSMPSRQDSPKISKCQVLPSGDESSKQTSNRTAEQDGDVIGTSISNVLSDTCVKMGSRGNDLLHEQKNIEKESCSEKARAEAERAILTSDTKEADITDNQRALVARTITSEDLEEKTVDVKTELQENRKSAHELIEVSENTDAHVIMKNHDKKKANKQDDSTEDHLKVAVPEENEDLDVTGETKEADATEESFLDLEISSDGDSDGACGGDEMSEDPDTTLVEETSKRRNAEKDDNLPIDTCSLASVSGGSSLYCQSTTGDEIDDLDEDMNFNDSLDKTVLKEESPNVLMDKTNKNEENEDDVLELHACDPAMFDDETSLLPDMPATPRRSPRKKLSTSTPRSLTLGKIPKPKNSQGPSQRNNSPKLKDATRSPRKKLNLGMEEGEVLSDEDLLPQKRDRQGVRYSRSTHESYRNKRRRTPSRERDSKRICPGRERNTEISGRMHQGTSSRYKSRRDRLVSPRHDARQKLRRSPSPEYISTNKRGSRADQCDYSRRDADHRGPSTSGGPHRSSRRVR